MKVDNDCLIYAADDSVTAQKVCPARSLLSCIFEVLVICLELTWLEIVPFKHAIC